jgi:tetratricopeptide (TPR) repeat protein
MRSLEEEGVSGPALFDRVAREVDADLVLHGDLVRQPGGTFAAHASIYHRPTSENAGNVFEENTDLFDLARDLASRILLSHSDAEPALKRDLITESGPALNAFVLADREFQAGNYLQAKALLLDAVEADPGFALAHYRLSQAALWAWDFAKARNAADDAWDLGSELTPQNRMLLGAWRTFLRSDPVLAERMYHDLLDQSPRNVEVLAGLGSVLVYYNSLRGRRSQEAIPYFRRALEANPKYGEVRYHVLESAARAGDRDRFDRWLRELNPASDQALAFQALKAFRWGTGEDRERVRRSLDAGTDEELVYATGRVAASIHDLSGARTLGELLLRPHRQRELRWGGHGLFAALAFASGKWQEAKRELERTAEGEPEWSLEMEALFTLFEYVPVSDEDLKALRESLESWEPAAYVEFSRPRELFGPHSRHHQELRLYLLGLLSVRLDELDAARDYQAELGRYGRTAETRALSLHLSESVAAQMAAARGDPEEALATLQRSDFFPPFEFIFASPFFSQALDRWLRAGLLWETEKPEDALAWYGTLSDGWGEFLFAAPAHLKQAQIHEVLGNRDEAIAHYQRFEALWADADPELQPLVEEAQAARERLSGVGLP